SLVLDDTYHHQYLHSFPTRRSSDLNADGEFNPTYRCLFPEPPPPGTVPACAEAGVLGALAGVLGSMMALEAIREIVGFGEGLVRSEEHTSELQSRGHLVCRLLLEKK